MSVKKQTNIEPTTLKKKVLQTTLNAPLLLRNNFINSGKNFKLLS